ncbi:unnamed protein product [Cyclocybe aegerita]|uniref:DUF6534 domain-containing protein n=1 Tax=Cyclocybe aegerita TaxID=1973307 RepID=A0A8S0WPJ7_CYCAE|nr:unnamed protein product [Cyclocybe aegerita]
MSIVGGELVGRDDTSILFMKYGPKWKHGRQLLHRWLSARNLEGYTPLQYEASCRTLKALLDEPDHFAENIKASVGSIILRITYGIDCKPRDDPWIAMADRTIEITAIASKPGRWLVDSFPILKYVPPFFPGAGFIRWAKKSRREVFEQIRLPFERVKDQVLKGSPAPCFVAEQLAEDWNNLQGAAEQHALACAAGSLYAGGIETVVSTIRLFLLAMITYPEIQRRAQHEVDTIIGSQRLATIEDRTALPYLGCIIKETLRHSSTVPLVPHSLDEDDFYEGHRIPKGSCVMVNIWAILNDPSIYKDPETFNPDRFAGPKPELDPSTISFAIGLGRRFCPGSHFALSVVFVMTSHLLSVFNILPPLDENGREYIPPMDFIDTHTRLWGIGTAQTYSYHVNYAKDPLFWRILTIGDLLTSFKVYFYVIQNYFNPRQLDIMIWGFGMQALFQDIGDLLVQCFFLMRIWLLGNKRLYLVIPPALFIAAKFGVGVAWAIKASQTDRITVSQKQYNLLSEIANGAAAIANILLAGTILYLLHRSRSGIRQSDNKITKIMIYTINTGAVTSIFSVLNVATAIALPDAFVYGVFYFCAGRLYLNTMLASLNARKSLARQKTSYVEMNLATFDASYEPQAVDVTTSETKRQQGTDAAPKRLEIFVSTATTRDNSP